MKTLKLSRASRSLAECARELDEEIVVLAERNKPGAAAKKGTSLSALASGSGRRHGLLHLPRRQGKRSRPTSSDRLVPAGY